MVFRHQRPREFLRAITRLVRYPVLLREPQPPRQLTEIVAPAMAPVPAKFVLAPAAVPAMGKRHPSAATAAVRGAAPIVAALAKCLIKNKAQLQVEPFLFF